MKMRPPAIPIITVDPYFTVWSPSDRLADSDTVHWTNSPNTIKGYVTIDGEKFRFMGKGDLPCISQCGFDMSALVTKYSFENSKIRLQVSFFAPLFTDDLYRLSRPVSYMQLRYSSIDGEKHKVSATLMASEELCINKKGEEPVVTEIIALPCGKNAIRMGSVSQKVLWRSADDIRIDWGYFYLASSSRSAEYGSLQADEMTYVTANIPLCDSDAETVAFAYDDIHSFNYFGHDIDAYWKKNGSNIETAIADALAESELMYKKCCDFSSELYRQAEEVGGEKYADLIALAYRQTIAAHKLAIDENGKLLFISKECFSGGHSATLDVTYPSSPFMLLYNTELLKAALRPIFRFAATDKWKYDFAPHDVGTYPILGTQRYGLRDGGILLLEMQMPVEECGNALILLANIAILEKNARFASEHLDFLEKWVKYLIKYGNDPENQLCSDDFAGSLPHNCNLSLKAIMGVAAYSIILRYLDRFEDADTYMNTAKDMADSWIKRASNGDGSFRLTFDRPGTMGMKYNMVWDKLWKTNLFPQSIILSEFAADKKIINPYGMPFDSLHTYTKTDWLVWTAMLSNTKKDFEDFIAPLWLCYNLSPSRVPMNDFYDTVTSLAMGCRHRSVVGGIFIKLLEKKLDEMEILR